MPHILPSTSKSQGVYKQTLLIDFASDRHHPTLTADEIFDTADEKLLRELGEDRRIERKPASIHCKELGEYISMWANTSPEGGLIVIGMADAGTPSGLSQQGAKRWNDLEKAHDIYASDARVESKRIPVQDALGQKDFVLLLRVRFSRTSVVLHSSSNAYMRVADTKKKLTPEEMLELQGDRGEISREMAPSTLSWPTDFDFPSVNKFCDAVKETFQIMEGGSAKQVLCHRRLGKLDQNGRFVPSVACALIFAKDPLIEVPGSKIHFLRFSGRQELTGSQRNVIKDQWFEGHLPDLIQNSTKFIGSQLREFSALGPGGRFYSDPEYPQDAWYEAVVNAIVHRSYGLKNAEVTVRMFDDRLVIESPGGFPPTITPENIYTTRYPRNPVIMDALLHFQYVKCSNEGAKRMRREMLAHSLPAPEFSEIETAFCKVTVILRNNIDNRQPWMASDRLQKAHSAVFSSLADNEKRVMAFVAENRGINVSQAARVASCTWGAAKSLLFRLVGRGLLIHSSRRASGRVRNVDTKAKFTLPDK
jgi:ATP-dependent DNA helicase RecG